MKEKTKNQPWEPRSRVTRVLMILLVIALIVLLLVMFPLDLLISI